MKKFIPLNDNPVTVKRAADILGDWVMRADEPDTRDQMLILERIYELLEKRFTDKDFADL